MNKVNALLYTFRYAVNKTTMREVSILFDLSKSTCSFIIERMSKFIVKVIGPQVIKFPETVLEKNQVAADFEEVTMGGPA